MKRAHYVITGNTPILVHNNNAVPGRFVCDLPASESAGGHGIDRHVGKDDAYLLGRNKPFASTFVDLAAATKETQANLDANAQKIASFLAGGKTQTMIRAPITDLASARVLSRSGASVPGKTVVSDLIKDASMPDGFRIHSSYVDP
ncbi:RNase A-like domain-containing protein [Micromonospora peucetia]|uniref:RNase A-like domain-containing protein n=1 Tax=Micromonospora peucetia TaxID=47871 RepID=UPI003322FADC